jgi:hypothetical protein
MILYVNGCSHSAGHCQGRIKTYSHIVASSIFGKGNFEVIELLNRTSNPNNFSLYDILISKIENKNNYLIFQAQHGKSNDRIFFESLNFLYECLKHNIQVNHSIIQWSGPNRTIKIEPKNNNHCVVNDINPHDGYEFGLKFEPFASIHTLQFMLVLQELYEKYNVNYAYIPYMELDKEVINNFFMFEQVNLNKFTTNPTKGYRNYFRKRGWVCDEQGHPSDYAHYYMAVEALKVLGEDSLIGLYDYYNFNELVFEIQYDTDIKFVKKNSNILGDATKLILTKLKNAKII